MGEVIKGSGIWSIGGEKIKRSISFHDGCGIRTTSLTNPLTGRDFADALSASEEFLIDVDGVRISGANEGLVLLGSRTDEQHGVQKTVIELELDGLIIELEYSGYKDMPVIRKKVQLRNTRSDRHFEINGLLASEHLAVPMTQDLRVQWVNGIMDPMNVTPNVFTYLAYGLEERDVEPGVTRVLTSKVPLDMANIKQWKRGKPCAVNHSNYSYFPWVVLRDASEREGMYFGLEWSGPWRVELSPSADSCPITVSFGTDFRHLLGPGESITGPEFFEGVFTGEVEDAGISTQYFVERHVTASAARTTADKPVVEPYTLPPACWNHWWGFETNINEDILRRQADEAARLGFEAFVVDYGWSLSSRDKRENRELFPAGIADLSQYVKRLGMKFGLWVCITGFDPCLAPTSDPYEWFVRTEEGDIHDEGNIAYTCACLASDYRHHLRDELDRIITEYKVDWLKYDQNMFFNCYAQGHAHQNEYDAPYFQVRAFYDILDYLLGKHPNLFVECALSGAMILDYGILRRSHTAYLLDDSRSYFVRRSFHGASYPLPPRFCTSCAAHPCTNWDTSAIDLDMLKDTASRRRYFDYFYRASIMGGFNVSDDLPTLPPEARESLERAIEIYKTVRRRIKGPVRHILPQPRDPREWDAAEVYDEQLREGMVFVFRPSSVVPEMTLRLRGLDEDETYTVRSEDQGKVIATSSGRELMDSGLQVRIENTTGSDILYFHAQP